MPGLIGATVGRAASTLQNALEVARFGGLDTGELPAPYEIAGADGIHRLRHYFPDEPADGLPAIVLVPPMMLAADVWDVSANASAVRDLHAAGIDPWVVDFGAPEHEEGGLERTLADHVVAVSDAVDRVRELTGRDAHLGGYSQGGMFCYQTAAYRRSRGVASLVTFGSPVDTRGMVPFGLPEDVVLRGAGAVGSLGRYAALPAWASRLGFRMLDPVKAARQQVEFVLALHDREGLLAREGQRRFLQADGWVAWPGPALADFVQNFVAHNRMLRGGFAIDGRMVTLADLTCPVLTFVGEVDQLAPAASVRPIAFAAPRAEVYERALRAGHFGLVVGSAAHANTWPTVADWIRWCAGDGALPADVHRSTAAEIERHGEDRGPGVAPRATYGLQLAGEVSLGIARSMVSASTQTVKAMRALGEEAVEQLPRLTRLEQVRPGTRTSLGLMLDQQARRAPDEVFFLFEDRAHEHAEAKLRIDAVVRGLLSTGVRRGEHVGVLMEMRPSALTVVAALNRIGAVAVLLRPSGESVAREARLGAIARLVCDPDHADAALDAGVDVYVLGGGGRPRDLGPRVVDLERIDPDAVDVPAWYRPNPGRARDLAFVLFTGEGEHTRVNRITNRRWMLSAIGTASSASLRPGDTVYSVTPVSHPSGLLVGLGGAIAGGARIALARRYDPATFWDEVRRYGVTIATYTWTMLRELVDAPPDPNERHHPVRLFVGSGMPPSLWRRVQERFDPARVVEFYTSSVGEAIFVNLGRKKVGAMGRRLPGSAHVRIAAYDIDAQRLDVDDRGLARPCGRGEVGMLLAEVMPEHAAAGIEPALRGVFAPADAWAVTGDLFRRDEDGDYWLFDGAEALLRTADGLVSPARVRDSLEVIDAVDLAVAYGAATPHGQVAVAAVALRPGARLSAAALTAALVGREVIERPTVVRVVDELPLTAWYRPLAGPLRAEGLTASTRRHPAWMLDADGGRYRPLDAAAIKRLAG